MPTLHDQLDGYWRLQADLGNGRFARDTLNKTALRTKQYGLVQLDRFIGSDRKMRNFPTRRRQQKGGIRYKMQRSSVRINFVPAGMWGLIESNHPPTAPLIARTETRIVPFFKAEQDKQVARRLRLNG